MFTRRVIVGALEDTSIENLFNIFEGFTTTDLERIMTTVNFILLDRDQRDYND